MGDPHEVPQTEKKLRYPRSVFFIISNEFCERFSYYGMRAVLALYMNKVLLYNEDESTVLYHAFTFLCYFFPLVGAIIADSFWGKFKTILVLSGVYAIGNIVLSTASATILGLPTRELSILGLTLVAVGTGGIKPCVSAFGGDQFVLPQQERQLQQFFSIFYFAINAGSLISTFITPIFREDIQCLGQKTCYPLAFGVPATLMIGSIFIFAAGRTSYVIKRPEGNIIVHVSKCVVHALRNRFFNGSGVSRQHWLDHADDKFEAKQIEDVKALCGVLYLLLPLPFFWALFDQQASRWTFQATLMDGVITSWWTIKPDQMQIFNPLLILAFIPLFETFVYPILRVIGIRRPLQKIALGGFLSAVAFLLTALVEYNLEPSYPVLPTETTGQLRVINGFDCELMLSPPLAGNKKIPAFGSLELINVPDIENTATIVDFNYLNPDCKIEPGSYIAWKGDLTLQKGKSITYLLQSGAPQSISMQRLEGYDDLTKAENGKPKLSLVTGGLKGKIILKRTDDKEMALELNSAVMKTDPMEIDAGSYSVTLNGLPAGQIVNLKSGGVYYLLLKEDKGSYINWLYTLTQPATLHMIWLLPQIIIITAAEILFSVTGLEFSYSQAPKSMKSLISSAWLLTVAFGNIIVVVIAEAKFFDRRVYEFLLYTILMLVDMIIFVLMSMSYKYRKSEDDVSTEETNLSGQDNKMYVTEN